MLFDRAYGAESRIAPAHEQACEPRDISGAPVVGETTR